jgi:hypothetical protein
MKLEIISRLENWEVLLIPQLESVSFSDNKSTIAKYFLNINFNDKSFSLPFDISFKSVEVSIIDDNLNFVEKRLIIVKEREPAFNLFQLIKQQSNEIDFHVVAQTVCLLNTYHEDNSSKEIQEDNLLPKINADSFYLKKDKDYLTNVNLKYAISNDILSNDLIYCPLSYFPLNCKMYSHRNTILTENINECESILFDKRRLSEFRKATIKKIEKISKADNEAWNFNYFRKGGWKNDYTYYRTENQFDDPEDY